MENGVFVDVILPLPIRNIFTYSIPDSYYDKLEPGSRVVVQFGKKKLYTALVYSVHSNKPELYKAKPIEGLLDELPIVNQRQFKLWNWISEYYMCSLGEVMKAALPSGLKLESESKIILKKEVDVNLHELNDDDYLIYEALQTKNILSIDEVSEILNNSKVHVRLKSLLEKGVILIYEELKEKFKPKIEDFIQLTTEADNETELKKIFSALEKKAFKQLEVLMAYIQLSDRYSKKIKEVKKSDLIKQTSAGSSVISDLEKKNIFQIYKKETGRFASTDATHARKILSPEQESIANKIILDWKKQDVVLLHGVTSSGKTEVYVKLIEDELKKGKQVLYLLPEIALTTQIVNKIQKYFGDSLGVYHSKFNENERVEIWNKVINHDSAKGISKFQIILGARSSLFLPFTNLGLILVDEEHDASFKQHDPAPRYNARDTAIVLAKMHNAKVLLGSATPSIESFHNAKTGKYGLATLSSRYGGMELPEILIADIKEDTKRKKMKSHFSPLLMASITEALNEKEQIIIFQNRRGFAPMLECSDCGWVPQCRNCDVSLVYHKSGSHLRCHYCGYITHVPPSCSACGNTALKMKNFGTEKIEEELQLFFPEARIARMDHDSTRSKFSYQNILTMFEERSIDILVGTQMVTKGLDFENVSLVGILSADQMMNFPDFRSHERSYQIMSQVAGRSGRKNKRGKVIIQTYNPKDIVIEHVINHEYEKMYSEELEHRQIFHYPPFYRLIELTIIHKNFDTMDSTSGRLAEKLKLLFGNRVLGPEFPLITRIKNRYHKKILIKIGREESPTIFKTEIRTLIEELQNDFSFNSGKVQINIDPM